jgi:hypothetical protein
MRTGPVRVGQKAKQCVYSIPCDCSRCYISETSRPLEVCTKEHKYNLAQGLLEKSKLAQHAFEEVHKICWNEEKVLQIELNTTYRKYEESTQMSLLDLPISQPSLDISPIWITVITAEVKKLQLRQVYIEEENLFFLCWYHERYVFSPVMISVMMVLWCKASYMWSFNNVMFP